MFYIEQLPLDYHTSQERLHRSKRKVIYRVKVWKIKETCHVKNVVPGKIKAIKKRREVEWRETGRKTSWRGIDMNDNGL